MTSVQGAFGCLTTGLGKRDETRDGLSRCFAGLHRRMVRSDPAMRELGVVVQGLISRCVSVGVVVNACFV